MSAILRPSFAEALKLLRSQSVIADDFLGDGVEGSYSWTNVVDGVSNAQVIGSGPLTNPDADHLGIMELTTDDAGAVVGSAALVNSALPSNPANLHQWTFDLDRPDELYEAWLIQLSDLSAAANRFVVQAGFSDNFLTGDPAVGLVHEYTDNVNGGNWRGRAFNGGNTNVNGAVAGVAGAWTLLEKVLSRGECEFFVDGESLGSVNANIPTGAALCSPCIKMDRTVQAAGVTRVLEVDFCIIVKRALRG
jgi:hypothetical protein